MILEAWSLPGVISRCTLRIQSSFVFIFEVNIFLSWYMARQLMYPIDHPMYQTAIWQPSLALITARFVVGCFKVMLHVVVVSIIIPGNRVSMHWRMLSIINGALCSPSDPGTHYGILKVATIAGPWVGLVCTSISEVLLIDTGVGYRYQPSAASVETPSCLLRLLHHAPGKNITEVSTRYYNRAVINIK